MKNRIVIAMGGKCCVCGYNKCNKSLALHHINPSEKEFSLGAIRACPVKWETIVQELKKCILVCHNCHGEIHAGVLEIADNAKSYDENLDITPKTKEKTYCPVCGDEKPIHSITCSKECAGKKARKFDWDRIDLLEELKNKTITQIAKEIGVSDVAVHKRIKRIKSIPGCIANVKLIRC